jgi:hypothetical protein
MEGDVLQFPQKLLPILQLTRMALVFTALADSGCALLLWAARTHPGTNFWQWIAPRQAMALMMISIGLYGFGMSLNDIIDRRRDQRLAAHRPLPSGRIRPMTAMIVCALLALMAAGGGVIYSLGGPEGMVSLMIVGFTMALIVFYDFAAKYLVAPGLITLGLIRFFHAAIAAPRLPILWQPLTLLDHVTMVSTVAYWWEMKRPVLTRGHFWSVVSGLAGINGLLIGVFVWRRWQELPSENLKTMLGIQPGLLLPAGAAVVFIIIAFFIGQRPLPRRQNGQALMLMGLLWLIVYDAAFVAGYVGYVAGGLVLLLLPVAWLSVQLMRWTSRLMVLTQRPRFKRVEA